VFIAVVANETAAAIVVAALRAFALLMLLLLMLLLETNVEIKHIEDKFYLHTIKLLVADISVCATGTTNLKHLSPIRITALFK